jgi:hypothetical protein
MLPKIGPTNDGTKLGHRLVHSSSPQHHGLRSRHPARVASSCDAAKNLLAKKFFDFDHLVFHIPVMVAVRMLD